MSKYSIATFRSVSFLSKALYLKHDNICRSVPGVFGNHQANYLSLIKQMLQQSLIDTSSYHVSAIYLFYDHSSIILADTSECNRSKFQCTLMSIIVIILLSVASTF